jgi:hypothetical protein
MDTLLRQFGKLLPYQLLLGQIKAGDYIPGLGLPRAARLSLLASLHSDLQRAVLLVTDRADHAQACSMSGLGRGIARFHFAERTRFYEQLPGRRRRERLQALTDGAISPAVC